MKSRHESARRTLVATAALLIGLTAAHAEDTTRPEAACDTARAERVATQCMICHTLGPDEGSSVGPGLWSMYGRKAASVAGFPYSKAFRALDLSWDEAALDRFLTAPMAMVPGTMMAFAGLRDPTDRAAIICKLEASR